MRRTAALIAFVCAVVAGGSPLHDDDHDEHPTFRDMVQRIVRATRENLRPLKTFRIEMHPSMHYWYESSDMLPGAKTCRVYEHPQLVYKCAWEKPASGSVESLYSAIAKQLHEALDPALWTAASVRKPRPKTRWEPLNPSRNGVVEVVVAGTVRDASVEVAFFPIVRKPL